MNPIQGRLSRICLMTVALCAISVAPATLAGDSQIRREGAGQRRALLDTMEGKPAPALQLRDWIGSDAQSLEDLRGKVVLLDFWGVWCRPCHKAIPKLNELHDEYADDGLVIIGVHTTSGASKMAEFAERYEIRYPIAVDIDDGTAQAYHVDTWPDIYLIDHNGVLRFADIINTKHSNVEAAVALLLAERAADKEGA